MVASHGIRPEPTPSPLRLVRFSASIKFSLERGHRQGLGRRTSKRVAPEPKIRIRDVQSPWSSLSLGQSLLAVLETAVIGRDARTDSIVSAIQRGRTRFHGCLSRADWEKAKRLVLLR